MGLKHKDIGTNMTRVEWELLTSHELTDGARGDLLFVNSSDEIVRLPKGSSGQVLKMGANDPAWGTDNDTTNHMALSNIGTNAHSAIDTKLGNSVSHIADNTQAHSDYLLNNASDATSGTLTAANLISLSNVTVGVAEAEDGAGILTLLGGDTDNGAQIVLHSGADVDGVTDFWKLEAGEDGLLLTGEQGTGSLATSRIFLVTEDARDIVFNPGGVDQDFRIESVNSAYGFFHEGSSGNISMGIAVPNTIGSGTPTGLCFNVTSATSHGRIICQGAFGANLYLVDMGGAADQKILQIKNDAAVTKFNIMNDAFTAPSVDDVFSIDMTNGDISMGYNLSVGGDFTFLTGATRTAKIAQAASNTAGDDFTIGAGQAGASSASSGAASGTLNLQAYAGATYDGGINNGGDGGSLNIIAGAGGVGEANDGTGGNGGSVSITAGIGGTGGDTQGNGGNITLTIGTSTADDGNFIINNLPTSDPTVAGALWSNAGIITMSSG